MFLMCSLVFASADASNISPGDKNFLLLQWQTTLMDRFYSPKSKVEQANSLSNAPLPDYCDWNSVRCVDGKMVELQHHRDRHDKLMDIHVLPPTVGDIHLTSCSLDYALHTRALPRTLKDSNVSRNQLHGSVGLRTLPEHLVSLDLSMNQLVGPVDLTELPRNLKTLDLWNNRIRQYVVFFGQLPPNLKYVKFHFVAGNNRITKLRGTSTENVERLGEIFPDMPRKHIHIE